jgi:hypothetical protein
MEVKLKTLWHLYYTNENLLSKKGKQTHLKSELKKSLKMGRTIDTWKHDH